MKSMKGILVLVSAIAFGLFGCDTGISAGGDEGNVGVSSSSMGPAEMLIHADESFNIKILNENGDVSVCSSTQSGRTEEEWIDLWNELTPAEFHNMTGFATLELALERNEIDHHLLITVLQGGVDSDCVIVGNKKYVFFKDLNSSGFLYSPLTIGNTTSVCDVTFNYYPDTSSWEFVSAIEQGVSADPEDCFDSAGVSPNIKSEFSGFLIGSNTYEILWNTFWDMGLNGNIKYNTYSDLVINYTNSSGQSAQVSRGSTANEVFGNWQALPGSTVTMTLTTMGYQVTASQQIPNGGGGDPPCDDDPNECP